MALVHRKSLAKNALGKSVISINPNINDQTLQVDNASFKTFGVKDTGQIPKEFIHRLKQHPDFIWLTIDKAADKGRAIDTELTNPLTYRRMTGSSSGGPINILKGINDFAIGTDGGGSVLAPAMSCQLPAIIGAGLGLHVKKSKKSTDGRTFTGSVGVIGKRILDIIEVIEILAQQSLAFSEEEVDKKLKIVIPQKGSITCPDNIDMHEKVMNHLSKIALENYELVEMDMHGADNRSTGINLINEAFQKIGADLMVTCEGPVDVYGYGETIPQQFGKAGEEITSNHGKYLIRAANMCETTGITIPTNDLASGLLVLSKKGIESSKQAIDLAKRLEESIDLPDVWKRYFLTEQHTDSLKF